MGAGDAQPFPRSRACDVNRCPVCNCEVPAGRLMCQPHWNRVPIALAWMVRTAWSVVKHTRNRHREGRASRADVLNAIAEYGNVRRRAVDAVLSNDTR